MELLTETVMATRSLNVGTGVAGWSEGGPLMEENKKPWYTKDKGKSYYGIFGKCVVIWICVKSGEMDEDGYLRTEIVL